MSHSQAISTSTSLLLNGFTSATNYYINHSAPAQTQTSKDGTPPPPPPRALLLLSHPRTHQTLSRAYAISGQAVKVSSKTVGIVEDLIKRAVGGSNKGKAPAAPRIAQPRPQPSATPSAQSVPPASLDAPPPYPGASAALTPDGKPPLPPRRNAAPAAVPSPGPPPPLPPRGKSPQPGSQAATPSASAPESGTSTPGRPVKTKEKLLLSANLILSTIDDSIKRSFDVGSERVSAVVAHKYGPDAGRSTHLATHTARNVVLVYVDMQGFARRALIKKAGKHWLKARLGGEKEMSGLVVDKQETAPKS